MPAGAVLPKDGRLTTVQQAVQKANGRPSKYKKSYDKRAMAILSDGGTIVEVAAALNVMPSAIYDWIDPKSPRYKESFSEAIGRGKAKSEAWWIKTGREGIHAKSFNTGPWTFSMKNLHGWVDRVETTNTTPTAITVNFQQAPQIGDTTHKVKVIDSDVRALADNVGNSPQLSSNSVGSDAHK